MKGQVSVPIQPSQQASNSYAGGLWTFVLSGNIVVQVQKEFNLVNPAGHNLPLRATVTQDDVLQVVGSSSEGSYVLTGAYYSTPPLDGVAYWFSVKPSFGSGNLLIRFIGDMPRDVGSVWVTSNNTNILDCNPQRCLAKKPGTARVKVDFVSIDLNQYSNDGNNYIYMAQLNIHYPNLPSTYKNISFNRNDRHGHGFGVMRVDLGGYKSAKPFTYEYPPIEYSITVESNNQPQEVRYESTEEIGVNQATAKWSYSDPDNDPQTEYQVQLASNSNYSSIVKNLTGNADVREKVLSNLSPNTEYWPRVRARNAVNGWSEWSNGAKFKTGELGPNQGEVKAQPLSASKPGQAGVLTSPPQITVGQEVELDWSIEQRRSATIDGNASNQCRAISPNWSGTWTGAGRKSVQVQVPTTLGIHSYSLACSGAAAWEDWILSTLLPRRGYSRGIRNFRVSDEGTQRRFRYETSTNVEVIPPPSATARFTVNGEEDNLTVKSGEELEFRWEIENSESLRDCRAETIGRDQNIWRGSKSRQGGQDNARAPISSQREEYTFRLICQGIAGTRNIDERVNLVVEPGPAVMCSSQTGTVEDGVLGKVETEVVNAGGPYSWQLFEGKQPERTQTRQGNNRQESWEIDYRGAGLGNKRARIEVRVGNGEVVRADCPSILNYGDRKVKEVN